MFIFIRAYISEKYFIALNARLSNYIASPFQRRQLFIFYHSVIKKTNILGKNCGVSKFSSLYKKYF